MDNEHSAERSHWTTTTKLVVVAVLLLLVVWLLVQFSAALPWLIISALLAFLLTPPTNWVVRRTSLPRGLAIGIIFLVLIGLMVLVPVLVAPSLVSLTTSSQFDFQAFNEFIDSLSAINLQIGPINVHDLLINATQGLENYISQAALSLLSMLSSLFWVAFVIVVTFWLIKDSYKLEGWLYEHLPKPYRRDAFRLLREFSLIWGSFFKGTLALAFVVGSLVGLSMWILGLQHVFLLAIFAGFMEFIPSLGPTLGATLAVFVAFFGGSSWIPLENWMIALIVLAVYTFIFQFEQVYLYPRVVGRRVNLHPGVVFVGAILGAVEFGLLGVMLAAPTLASSRILLRYIFRRLADQEPFPEEPEKVAAAIQWRGMLRGQPVAAILFDLDGTLAETDEQIIDAILPKLGPLQRFFPDADARPFLRRWVMRMEGFAAGWLARLDAVDLDDDAFRLAHTIRQMLGYKKSSDLAMIEGAAAVLQTLRTRYRLGLVTTRDKHSTLRFLQQHHLENLFDVIVTRDDVKRLKPHSEPVFRAAQEMNLTPEQCVMVGDTLADIRAARAANAAAVGVLTGFGSKDDLDEADLVLPSVADLGQWL